MFTKSSVSQALIDATKAIMEASDKKLLLEPSKKMPDAAKVPERVQAAISKKQDDKAAASGSSAEVRESNDKKHSDNPNSPFNYKGQPSTLFKKPGSTAGFDSKKISTGTVYTRKYKKDKEDVKEEIESVEEAKFDALKHIKNPSSAVKAAAKDVKRGSYADRAALMKAGGVKDDRGPRGVTQEEIEQIEERELSKGETAEKERIVKGMKKNLSGFKARYGDRAKSVMYATATKSAKNEEVEFVDEGLMDKAKELGKKVLDKVGHGDDEDMIKDLQKKVGVPQTGKKPMKAEELKGNQHKIDKNKNGKIDAQDFAILRKEDIGGISTMSEKEKEDKEAENVRIEPNEDMKTKTVDTLAGRKKVPADYHNQSKSYKLKLNVEGKGTDVDPNFVTNENTPLKMAKDIAKKSFKKIRNEMLGMAGATSEEKKNDKQS